MSVIDWVWATIFFLYVGWSFIQTLYTLARIFVRDSNYDTKTRERVKINSEYFVERVTYFSKFSKNSIFIFFALLYWALYRGFVRCWMELLGWPWNPIKRIREVLAAIKNMTTSVTAKPTEETVYEEFMKDVDRNKRAIRVE